VSIPSDAQSYKWTDFNHGLLAATGLDGGTVCLVNEGRGSLDLAVHVNASPEIIHDLTTNIVKIGDCLCGACAQTGRPLIIWDNASGSQYATRETTRDDGLQFYAAFPLMVRGRAVGVLCVFTRGSATASPRSIELVEDLCGAVALAVENARMFEAEREARSRAEFARDQLSRVFERVSDAFVALDSDWRYTYVNARAGEMFGRDPASLIGKHIWTEFPDGIGQPFHKAYERAMAVQRPVHLEEYYPPFNRWFENLIYPSPEGLSIYFHDISTRKQAEVLINGQNQVLEMVAAGRPLPETLAALVRVIESHTREMFASILLLDEDGVHVRHGAAPSLPPEFVAAIDGQPIGPSAGSCGTAAYRREPVYVDDIATDPLWADYKSLALAHGLRACWSTPIFDEARRVLGTVALYYRQPGPPHPEHIRLVEIATSTAAVAIGRHRAESARRRSEQHHRFLFDCSPIGLALCSLDGTLARVNTAYASILGRTTEDTLRLSYWDITPERYAEQEREQLRQLRETGRYGPYEKEYIHRNGHLVPVRLNGLLIDLEGEAFIWSSAEDITERRVAEAALRESDERLRRLNVDLEQRVTERTAQLAAKNEELKSFTYTVSHDLKAPLRGISGYAQELERRHKATLGERAQFCVSQIIMASKNLDHLIEDLLAYSRLDAESPTPVLVQLPDLVRAVLDERRHTLVEYGVEVTVHVPALALRAWDRGLRQALTNLIDNAVKYSRRSSPPRVTITAESLPNVVRLAVADNGIGFDPRYHDRIFGLFNRLVPQDEFEGTGAGLAIVKKVVDKQGGRVWATSAVGQGATFFVELPAPDTTEKTP
jgi:PAS domain S-box-containing protein